MSPIITIDATYAVTEILGYRHSYHQSNREILTILHDLLIRNRLPREVWRLRRKGPSEDDFEVRR
jgi:hypothetical protein